jgi:hypothetical protein
MVCRHLLIPLTFSPICSTPTRNWPVKSAWVMGCGSSSVNELIPASTMFLHSSAATPVAPITSTFAPRILIHQKGKGSMEEDGIKETKRQCGRQRATFEWNLDQPRICGHRTCACSRQRSQVYTDAIDGAANPFTKAPPARKKTEVAPTGVVHPNPTTESAGHTAWPRLPRATRRLAPA